MPDNPLPNPRAGELCNRCNRRPARFSWQKSRHGVYRWMKQPCRVCRRRYVQQRVYGLTPSQLKQLKQSQQGKCAICGKSRVLHIDHDHSTGRVRALLCHPCNTAIGLFAESPKVLRDAALYLERHNNNGSTS